MEDDKMSNPPKKKAPNLHFLRSGLAREGPFSGSNGGIGGGSGGRIEEGGGNILSSFAVHTPCDPLTGAGGLKDASRSPPAPTF